MDDEIRAHLLEQIANRLPGPYVDLNVPVARHSFGQVRSLGHGGTGRSKELLAHVIVDADDLPAFARQPANAR
jgi:hypothetical protein